MLLMMNIYMYVFEEKYWFKFLEISSTSQEHSE
jgi:hypothetical protein